jgi:DNA-binding CsgD family transcriptional regulator
MSIQWRPMRPKDVRGCAEIIAAHPVNGARYRDDIQNLHKVWLNLLGREAFRAAAIESVDASQRATLIGVGVSAFVNDTFLTHLKTPPYRWVGPELVRQIVRGDNPLLSDQQVRQANSQGGLNLVTWEGALNHEFRDRPEAHTAVFSAFVEQHRGFLLKEMLAHGMSEELLAATLRSGGSLLDSEGCYTDTPGRSISEIFAAPHIVGITRELALSRVGFWIASLFIHEAPQFDFRPSEQRLLLTALRGGTDEELSDDLGISLSAVKKTWSLIYERAAAHLPGFSSNHNGSTNGASERGKEKKQRLLTYLRDHPEEMRPAAP